MQKERPWYVVGVIAYKQMLRSARTNSKSVVVVILLFWWLEDKVPNFLYGEVQSLALFGRKKNSND